MYNRRPGSEWALEQAKFNLVNNYFLVGVTEEMEDFIYLLELSLPRFVELCYRNTDKFDTFKWHTRTFKKFQDFQWINESVSEFK